MRLAQSKVHFIGVGGIGMSGLAELLANMGAKVSGSDLGENQQTLRLRELGIQIFIGHNESNLGDAEVCVFSSAVNVENVEFKAARKAKIPLIPRAEALAEVMRLRRSVAVGGSHGKTTTTSMIAAIFLHAKIDPTIVVGGRLDLIKSTSKLGAGEWLVAEADESDGSFNRFTPEVAIITNIDNDHLDFYGKFENLQRAFYEFGLRIPFYGHLIVCGDDKRTFDLFKDFPKKVSFYGYESRNDYMLSAKGNRYSVLHNVGEESKKWCEFELKVLGRHNGLNALASMIAAEVTGISPERSAKGLESFGGVDRRFQKRNEIRGVDFYDDYGHHPTEIEAVLTTFRENFSKRRLVVIFQPHRYTRTSTCWDQFKTCLKNCDELFLLDIYSAGEPAIPRINSERLAKEIDHPRVHYVPDRSRLNETVCDKLKSGDIVLTLGAGDIWKLNDEIANVFRNQL